MGEPPSAPPVILDTSGANAGTASPSAAAAPARRNPISWILGGAVVVVGLAVAAFFLIGRGEGQTITGTFGLFDPEVPSSCIGSGGYDDIRDGTSVTVRSETGETLATGRLGAGEYIDGVGCTYPITVEGVGDAEFYRVEVSHRGEVEYSRSELEANDWSVDVSLGESPA